MVSRRNFISIIIMMAVMLFMFQFSQIVRESQSNNGINIYISEEALSGRDRWQPTIGAENYEAGDFIVLYTCEGSAIENVVTQWCQYTKRELLVCGGPEEYEIETDRLPAAVLVDSDTVVLTEQLSAFEKITRQGVTLIFCNLPEPEMIRKSSDLRKLLGIQSVRANRIETEGIHLFSGFMLGGEIVYKAETEEEEKKQDLELNMPWYVTVGGAKTYMVGMLDELLEDEEAKNEYFPGLIWRNGYNDADVFVVNGNYMESMMGIGILDAMIYEAEPYVIYPVVNAQNVIVANFPGFAGENDAQMMEYYSRDTKGVLRDICWPAISGLARRNQYRLTCLMMAQYDYGDDVEPTGDDMEFYLQQFREVDTEAGISLVRSNDTDLAWKLEHDNIFYTSLKEDYAYGAVYAEEADLELLESVLTNQALLQNVTTIASPTGVDIPIVSYYNDEVTLQSVTAPAEFHSYSDDLWLRAVETSLGYSNVLLDMRKILYPEGEDDRWENASESVFSNLDTYWKPFRGFAQTTLSESDARIRNFLNLDYKSQRDGNTVSLELTGAEEGWFFLRTHGEGITYIEGADYQQLETDTYLLHVSQSHVEIELKKNRGTMEYGEK